MPKCHKGTVTVVGGLCDKVEVSVKMCGPEEVTDAMKEEKMKEVGTFAGGILTSSFCDMVKSSLNTTCQAVGGTPNDICGSVSSDFCDSMLEANTPALIQAVGTTPCESDDDCKAGTGAGDGTGGGTGGTTKKQCCSVIEKTMDTMCKDTTSVAMTAYVSINCRVVLRRGSAHPFAACGVRRRQVFLPQSPGCFLSCPLPRPLTTQT